MQREDVKKKRQVPGSGEPQHLGVLKNACLKNASNASLHMLPANNNTLWFPTLGQAALSAPCWEVFQHRHFFICWFKKKTNKQTKLSGPLEWSYWWLSETIRKESATDAISLYTDGLVRLSWYNRFSGGYLVKTSKGAILQGTYSNKIIRVIHKGICTKMFKAALLWYQIRLEATYMSNCGNLA